jgi:hypothetical protein
VWSQEPLAPFMSKPKLSRFFLMERYAYRAGQDREVIGEQGRIRVRVCFQAMKGASQMTSQLTARSRVRCCGARRRAATPRPIAPTDM